MTQTAYTRAVDMFEALLTEAKSATHTTPARLIQSAGLTPSSGYRHVAALEAEGLLRRDASGTYLPGLASIRTGFHGYGLGHLAPLAQPILVQLRQTTQHTAFVGVTRDMDLHIGPHSVGRETRMTQLLSSYSFETIPELDLGVVSETELRGFQDGIARRITALTVAIESTQDAIVILGLVTKSSRPPSDAMHAALRRARDQVSHALRDV